MQTSRIKCAKCHDVGWVIVKRFDEEVNYEYETSTPCDCYVHDNIQLLFKASRISEEFQKKSFDNFFLTDRPQPVRDAHYCAINYLKKFPDFREYKKNSIALMGRPGSGKTHLLMAIANGLIQQKIRVMYFPWVEGLNNLKDDFTKLDERIREMQEVEVLYLDDLFKARRIPTEFQMEQLFAVINPRYLNNRPLLLSSEWTMDEIIRFDEGLGSRLSEMCKDHTVFMVGGPELNYRLKE